MAGQNRFLVRRATGEVFVYTEALAKRKDLDEVFADSAEQASKKDSMPDPRSVSLEKLESMAKADLMIFGKIKLGLDLSADMTKSMMLDEVKIAIFTQPTQSAEQEQKSVKPVKDETSPLATAAAARGHAAM